MGRLVPSCSWMAWLFSWRAFSPAMISAGAPVSQNRMKNTRVMVPKITPNEWISRLSRYMVGLADEAGTPRPPCRSAPAGYRELRLGNACGLEQRKAAFIQHDAAHPV